MPKKKVIVPFRDCSIEQTPIDLKSQVKQEIQEVYEEKPVLTPCCSEKVIEPVKDTVNYQNYIELMKNNMTLVAGSLLALVYIMNRKN